MSKAPLMMPTTFCLSCEQGHMCELYELDEPTDDGATWKTKCPNTGEVYFVKPYKPYKTPKRLQDEFDAFLKKYLPSKDADRFIKEE